MNLRAINVHTMRLRGAWQASGLGGRNGSDPARAIEAISTAPDSGDVYTGKSPNRPRPRGREEPSPVGLPLIDDAFDQAFRARNQVLRYHAALGTVALGIPVIANTTWESSDARIALSLALATASANILSFMVGKFVGLTDALEKSARIAISTPPPSEAPPAPDPFEEYFALIAKGDERGFSALEKEALASEEMADIVASRLERPTIEFDSPETFPLRLRCLQLLLQLTPHSAEAVRVLSRYVSILERHVGTYMVGTKADLKYYCEEIDDVAELTHTLEAFVGYNVEAQHVLASANLSDWLAVFDRGTLATLIYCGHQGAMEELNRRYEAGDEEAKELRKRVFERLGPRTAQDPARSPHTHPTAELDYLRDPKMRDMVYDDRMDVFDVWSVPSLMRLLQLLLHEEIGLDALMANHLEEFMEEEQEILRTQINTPGSET